MLFLLAKGQAGAGRGHFSAAPARFGARVEMTKDRVHNCFYGFQIYGSQYAKAVRDEKRAAKFICACRLTWIAESIIITYVTKNRQKYRL